LSHATELAERDRFKTLQPRGCSSGTGLAIIVGFLATSMAAPTLAIAPDPLRGGTPNGERHSDNNKQRRARPVSLIVRAKGPSGPAKIRSDDPKHALSLVHYLRTIGYQAWIEDKNGNQVEEAILKRAIK